MMFLVEKYSIDDSTYDVFMTTNNNKTEKLKRGRIFDYNYKTKQVLIRTGRMGILRPKVSRYDRRSMPSSETYIAKDDSDFDDFDDKINKIESSRIKR